MRLIVTTLLVGAALGCQQINYDAASGARVTTGGTTAAAGGAGGPRVDNGDRATVPVSKPLPPAERPARCEMVTARAYGIVRDNCSFCHQNAGSKGGAFTFILDLPMLIDRPSPTGLSKPLLVP